MSQTSVNILIDKNIIYNINYKNKMIPWVNLLETAQYSQIL